MKKVGNGIKKKKKEKKRKPLSIVKRAVSLLTKLDEEKEAKHNQRDCHALSTSIMFFCVC